MTQATGDRDEMVSRQAARFDHHDPELSDDVLRGVYDRLLAQEGFGYSTAHGGMHLAAHHSDIRTVEKMCPAFSSAQGTTHPRPPDHAQNIPIDFDPPEHTPYRELFSIPLSPQAVRTFEPQLRQLTVELLEEFTKKAGDNFVSLVARPLPLLAIGMILGWDRTTNDRVVEYATQIVEHYRTPEVAEPFEKFNRLALSGIEDRRRCPRDDYLTTLANAEIDGRPLTEAEQGNIVRTFLFGGFETTMNAIALLVLHLARNPELQDELRAAPDLIERAVDEGLRAFPPVHVMFRTATESTTLEGTSFEVGDKVALLFAAANRDPQRFENPDSFDLRRSNARNHVAFGFGPHFCVGAHLARAEMRILLEELARYPKLELAGEPEYHPHLMMGQMMGLKELPLRFANAAASSSSKTGQS
jgi:cytochrome P450